MLRLNSSKSLHEQEREPQQTSPQRETSEKNKPTPKPIKDLKKHRREIQTVAAVGSYKCFQHSTAKKFFVYHDI